MAVGSATLNGMAGPVMVGMAVTPLGRSGIWNSKARPVVLKVRWKAAAKVTPSIWLEVIERMKRPPIPAVWGPVPSGSLSTMKSAVAVKVASSEPAGPSFKVPVAKTSRRVGVTSM